MRPVSYRTRVTDSVPVSRGRPRLRSDDEILAAALAAFADAGFQATSLRALSTSLGLSHEAVGQRFGTKLDLFYATVDFGLARLFAAQSAARTSGLGAHLRLVVLGRWCHASRWHRRESKIGRRAREWNGVL